jgi:excisionase family DNA binding protein
VRELFSYQEAAQVLGVSERTIRRLVREGLLPVVQLGSRVRRIDPDDLAAVIDRAKTRFPQ